MAQVKEHLIQLGQNSPHQAVLVRLLLLIDIHLLEDVHKDGEALLQQALQQNDCNALKLLIDVYGVDAEIELDRDGNNTLHFAAREGYEAAVRFLIEECKMAVNKPNSKGHTALHWAAKGGNPKLVTYLLAHGADVTVQAGNGETPLHRAARGNHTAICKQLIATGKANINAEDVNGGTVLHIAAGIGELELVTYLLTWGADVTAQDAQGGPPLHEAVCGGRKAVCEKLIAVGKADINAKNEQGLTALHLAVEKNDPELVAYLLACGADITVEDEYGATPLDLAASHEHRHEHQDVFKQLVVADEAAVMAQARDGDMPFQFHKAASKGYKIICEQLVSTGQVDVYAKDWLDDTALHLAARGGHIELVRWLVEECQVTVNDPSGCGETALHYAAGNGNPELVNYLLTKGAHITTQRHGDTPLHWAAGGGHNAACEQLITRGKADVNAKNRYGDTALHYAAKNGKPELVVYLLACGADATAQDETGNTPLHLAAQMGHKAVCEQLIATKKVGINVKNNFGLTALDKTVEKGNPDLVAYLLACEADFTAQDETGNTPLHLAALKGHKAVCEQLVATKRVDVNAQNHINKTALHFAAEKSDVELMAYLLAHGANVTAQDRSGVTPLHIAVKREDIRLVKLLLKAGARPNIKTYPEESEEDWYGMRVRRDGRTALKEAKQYSEIWGLLSDFSVIPEHAALVRQETLRVLLPLSLHPLLIPPLQNIMAGYVELPEELPAEQKQLMPSTLFVQIELVEQALLAFVQEINNPSLGLTYAVRIERLNASAEKIIATLEAPESCIHYWQQLQQQQNQIETDRIAVMTAETLLTKSPAACAQYLNELIATLNAKEAAILQVHRQAIVSNKLESKEKEQKHAADLSQQKNTGAEREKELADAVIAVTTARKIIALSFAERVQYLQTLKETLSRSTAAFEAIPRPSELPDVPPIPTIAVTPNPLAVSTASSNTSTVMPSKQEIKGSEPEEPFAMEDDGAVSSAWPLSQSSSLSSNSTLQLTASGNKQEVKERKQAQSASLLSSVVTEDEAMAVATALSLTASLPISTSTPSSSSSEQDKESENKKELKEVGSSASSSLERNPSTHFYQPARQKRVADEQAEQEHIKKPKNNAQRKAKERRNKSHS
jgi:ankyrin repeat protein